MPTLDSVSVETLRDELRRVDSPKAAQRLMIAIAHKDGVSQTTLARRYGYSRKTVYNWLTRLERESLSAALEDDPKPGRPSRLDDAERRRLEAHLRMDPAAFEYDDSEWTPELVRRHLSDAFDVSYTLRSARTMLNEATSEER
jgi:transposase